MGYRKSLLALSLLSLAVLAFGQSDHQVEVRASMSEQHGRYLVDSEGRSLYLFTRDDGVEGREGSERFTAEVRPASARCTGACLESWPPVDVPGGLSAGTGVDEEILYISNLDGILQATYNGWPLYYFVRDQEPGQTAGQGVQAFGGTWHLVSTDGRAITGQASTDEAEAAIATTDASGRPESEELRTVLMILQEGGLAVHPTPRVIAAFDDWARSLSSSGDEAARELAEVVEDVTAALSAEPFDRESAIRALRELALAMRAAASSEVPDHASLLVEAASLVHQNAGLLARTDFTPRLDVEMP